MKIHRVEKLTGEKWLNLFAASFDHNGKPGRWVFASRQAEPHQALACDAVVIVPILVAEGQPNRLVMVKEFRVPVGCYVHAFPAGLMEAEESIESAVERELREETGLEVVRCKRLSPPLFSSSGMTDEAALVAFVDARATADGRQALEPHEDIEVLLLDHAAVCRLCEDVSARFDAKAWLVLHTYQQLGRLE